MERGPHGAAGRLHPALLLIIAALAVTVYLNTFVNPFVYDDVTEIQANPRAHRLSAIPSLLTTEFWHGERGRGILYRPVTAATLPPLFLLGDGSPWTFHAASILLHALTASLLAAILARLSGRVVPGLVTGILFAVLPIHTEAVAWISGRSEVLYVATGAAAWWFHLRAREGGRPWSATAALVLLAASLGSKESAVAWPFIFAAADRLFPPPGSSSATEGRVGGRGAAHGRGGRTLRWLYPAYATLMLLWIAARYTVLGQLGRQPGEGAHLLNPLESETWWPAYPFTALRALALGLWKTATAAKPCIDYGQDQIPLAKGPLHADVLAGFALLAGIVYLAWRGLRRGGSRHPGHGLIALAAALFLLSWFPVSSLLLASVSVFAERNFYLPSLALCMAAGVLAGTLWSGRRIPRRALLAAGILGTLSLSTLTLARNTLYADGVTLFGTTAMNCARSARAHFLHGTALEEIGRYAEAAAAHARALEVVPGYVDARAELSRTLALQGRLDAAAREARTALAANPPSFETRLAVIAALAGAGLEGEAERLLSEIGKQSADDPRFIFIRAQHLRGSGRLDEALALYTLMRDRFPGNPAGWNGIGATHMQRGRAREAREAFKRALDIDPYDMSGLYNLGLLALRSRPETHTLSSEAAGLFRRYLRIVPRDPLGWIRLGEALERLGEMEEAGLAFDRAVTLAPDHPRPRKALEEFNRRRRGE
jgi:tetratricopeptide (TPR) repeat protein